MTVSSLPQGMNVAQLRRAGLVLYPKEVVAMVHALCDQAVSVQTPDELWITDEGHVLVCASAGAARAVPGLTSMGVLIETLLPPFSEERQYAPAASLHRLPARLRGTAGPPIGTTQELLYAIQHYETDAPTRVLQRLFARAEAAAPERSLIASVTPGPVDADRLTALAPLEGGHDSPDEDPSARTGIDDATRPDGRPPVHVAPNATERAATAAVPRARMWAVLCVGMSLGWSGYGGYRLVRHLQTHDGQMATSQTFDLLSPLSARPIRAGMSTLLPHSRGLASRSATPADRHSGSSPSDGGSPRSALTVVGDHDHDDSASTRPSRPLNLSVPDGAFSPSFAAAGAAVFFHAGRQRVGRLLEADLDQQGAPFQIVTVLQDHAKNYHPRVSPDERLLAFDSDRDGERGVYVADRDGTHVHRVSGPGFAALPSWSPDMKWLAFVRAESDRPHVWNLWLRNMESGALTRLTSYRVGQTWAASWFPDAQRVCYSHEDQLVLLTLATGTTDVFPSPRAGRLVRTPAVSPDGHQIIFQVFRDGAWIVDLETRSMRKVLDDATAEEFAWHPLGHRVAYHSRKDGEWRLWVTIPSS